MQLKTGLPVYEQVVYAVTKAVVSGQLQPGDRFPSVRVLSQELRINPNTAHKVVATLINNRLLEVEPGKGTLVAQRSAPNREQLAELLDTDAERLVVQAKNLSLELEDVQNSIRKHWNRLVKEIP